MADPKHYNHYRCSNVYWVVMKKSDFNHYRFPVYEGRLAFGPAKRLALANGPEWAVYNASGGWLNDATYRKEEDPDHPDYDVKKDPLHPEYAPDV